MAPTLKLRMLPPRLGSATKTTVLSSTPQNSRIANPALHQQDFHYKGFLLTFPLCSSTHVVSEWNPTNSFARKHHSSQQVECETTPTASSLQRCHFPCYRDATFLATEMPLSSLQRCHFPRYRDATFLATEMPLSSLQRCHFPCFIARTPNNSLMVADLPHGHKGSPTRHDCNDRQCCVHRCPEPNSKHQRTHLHAILRLHIITTQPSI